MSSDESWRERAPLVPPEVDLRGYEYMPFYGGRLRDSGLNSRATDSEFRAAVNLWWSAWNQVPAASLPDDERELCRLADLARDLKTWAQVRDVAMRGFVKCSDGRFYHSFLAEIATKAFELRNRQRNRTEAARNAAQLRRQSQHKNSDDKLSVTESIGKDRKGEDRKELQEQGAPPSRATRLPPSWSPPDSWLKFALETRRWTYNVALEVAQEFKDYWIAKPGQDGTKLDWEATWRNWVRKERERGTSIGGQRPANLLNKQEALEARNAAVIDSWTPPEVRES
jgi:hypothetical protein